MTTTNVSLKLKIEKPCGWAFKTRVDIKIVNSVARFVGMNIGDRDSRGEGAGPSEASRRFWEAGAQVQRSLQG